MPRYGLRRFIESDSIQPLHTHRPSSCREKPPMQCRFAFLIFLFFGGLDRCHFGSTHSHRPDLTSINPSASHPYHHQSTQSTHSHPHPQEKTLTDRRTDHAWEILAVLERQKPMGRTRTAVVVCEQVSESSRFRFWSCASASAWRCICLGCDVLVFVGTRVRVCDGGLTEGKQREAKGNSDVLDISSRRPGRSLVGR